MCQLTTLSNNFNDFARDFGASGAGIAAFSRVLLLMATTSSADTGQNVRKQNAHIVTPPLVCLDINHFVYGLA